MGEVERVFDAEALEPVLEAYAEEQRRAVLEGRVTVGMDAAAVEMAWGAPARRAIALREGNRDEVWTYADGQQVAFAGGKVIRVGE